MATVTTTTATNPLRYPSATFIDVVASNGYLYALAIPSTANVYQFWRSTDSGASWVFFMDINRTGVAEVGPIHVCSKGWLHWIYRTNESSEDRIYYTRIDGNGVGATHQLMAVYPNGGVAGSIFNGIDFQVVNYGPGGTKQVGVVVAGHNFNSKLGVAFFGIAAPAGGQPALSNGSLTGTRHFLMNTGTGRVGPSVDFEHTGDAKTSANPNVWVTFGRTNIYMCKLSWHGSGWIIPTTPVDVTGAISARDYVPGRWDGNRFLIARYTGSTVLIHERNKANTSTTLRTSPTHPQGVTRSVGLSYNSITGDPRVFAVGTSTNDLYYVDFIRSTGLWGSWTIVTSTDILGGFENFSVRSGSATHSRYDVLTAHSGAPNTIVHQSLALAYPPTTPTWVFDAVPYVNGGAADTAASLLLDWLFSDPDPLDVQGSYALSRQVGVGALEYWRASDNTWQVAEVQNTSATTQLTLTSTQWSTDGAAGGPTDVSHTYRVKVWDSTGVASAYSSGLVLIPSVKVDPVITTPLDGSTYALPGLTVTWTAAEQTAFQVQLLIFGSVLTDSGKVVSSATSYDVPYTLINGFSFSLLVWTWNNEGLKSTQVQSNFSVAFVAPATPTHVATPVPASGWITVQITNPAAAAVVSTGTVTHGNNASVTPGLPASMATGDAMFVLSAIRNSGTGSPNTPTDYTELVKFGNVALYGKIHDGSESAPLCSYTGGVAGADTTAQMIAFRRAGIAVLGSPATQLNASAANIAYPALTVPANGCIVFYLAWKQSVTTTFTTPAGFTEIAELSTATGDDQSLVWGYVIQTTAANISSGTITTTGGVSAISRAIIIATSGVPVVAYNNVYRLPTGAPITEGVRVGQNIAPNGSVNDFRASARKDWSYRVQAYGENGTVGIGAWAP